jgi:hypothetical protein
MGGVSDFGEHARARPADISPRNNKSANTRPGGIAVIWNTVAICDAWGAGADHSLKPSNGEPLDFRLQAQTLPNPEGGDYVVNYAVDPRSNVPAGWKGAIFTPVGKDPVQGIRKLPDWDDTKRDEYRKAVDDAYDNLCDSRTERLESIIPYVDENGQLGYNAVRLFYVPNVRTNPPKHLFVIKTATFKLGDGTVQACQDGSAHGPPA